MDEKRQDEEAGARLSEAARAMAAARRIVGVIRCEMCGKEVTATTAGRPDRKKRFCSAACIQRAYRQRHPERINARQRERRAQQKRGGERAPEQSAERSESSTTSGQ